jgi:hypothetical protein
VTILLHRTLPRVSRRTETVVGISFPRKPRPPIEGQQQSSLGTWHHTLVRMVCVHFLGLPLLAVARDARPHGKGIRDEERCAWTSYADARLHGRSPECSTIHLRVRRACETLSCSRESLTRKSHHPQRRTTCARHRACRGEARTVGRAATIVGLTAEKEAILERALGVSCKIVTRVTINLGAL